MQKEKDMIETKDLILKQGSADDWQDLYRNLWSRGEVFRYMFTKPSLTEEHAMKKTAAYAEMHKEVKTEFFVYDKATKQAIGIAGLYQSKRVFRPKIWWRYRLNAIQSMMNTQNQIYKSYKRNTDVNTVMIYTKMLKLM